jgi:hypothetical protein
MLAQSPTTVPDDRCRIRVELAHKEFDLRCHHSAKRLERSKALWKGPMA